jgi:hypothetical protein
MPTQELYNILAKVESIANDAVSNTCFLLTISELAIESAQHLNGSNQRMESVAFLTQHHAKTVLDTLNALLEIVNSAQRLLPRGAMRPNTEQSLQADKEILAAHIEEAGSAWREQA